MQVGGLTYLSLWGNVNIIMKQLVFLVISSTMKILYKFQPTPSSRINLFSLLSIYLPYHSNIGVQIIVVLDLGMSTLISLFCPYYKHIAQQWRHSKTSFRTNYEHQASDTSVCIVHNFSKQTSLGKGLITLLSNVCLFM